jgi:hypothetical protein
MDFDAYFIRLYDATNYAHSDFRPISLTPILCRVAEKSFVQKWLKPALPVEALNDQFAISKPETRTAHLTNALIMSLFALSKIIASDVFWLISLERSTPLITFL